MRSNSKLSRGIKQSLNVTHNLNAMKKQHMELEIQEDCVFMRTSSSSLSFNLVQNVL